jgi:DNA mismatch repair protein MutS
MTDALTPMMQQYQRLRRSIPADTLLLFRLGDFYELFFEDAKEASGLLNVALTKRNGVPMCGVPYHAAPTYIARLIKAGHRVAVCDQTSDPQPGKIVSRDITQIISAGTVSDLDLLEAKRANYLGAVCADDGVFGFAYADLSTGEFRLTEARDRQSLLDELARVGPAELLVSDEQKEMFGELLATAEPVLATGRVRPTGGHGGGGPGALSYDSYAFLPEQAAFTLCEHFKVKSLDGFGCGQMPQAVAAAGAMAHYLKHQLRRKVEHLRSLRCDAPANYVVLDAATQTNLELVDSRRVRDTSLLAVLDRTVTPMGGRKLRGWILQPLRDLPELERRQQMIADLLQEPDLLASIRAELKSIRDIERAAGRLSQVSGNARDLTALKVSLQQIPKLKGELAKLIERMNFGRAGSPNPPSPGGPGGRALPVQLQSEIHEMPALAEKLGQAIVDDPPLALKEGGIFRDGYDVDLDTLRQASREGKSWIGQLQEREIAATGIKSLKVRYNSVFGYFIEITKSNLANVPAHYTRKQTTVGGERFATPELKEMEAKILGADERARQIEYQLFQKVRDETLRELGPIQQTAAAIAIVDVICALAESARLYRYCRPQLNDSLRLIIKDGRHPVLDQNLIEEKFVPNDTALDGETLRLAIITGPNMAGKSTYIRQVALIVLMAQMGSFVPAESAEIGLVDRIFTRVGANDDLARGQSTFMVEMNETSNIVNNATEHSLVILDEIGRGTSTFDGLSIAWSVAEFLHDKIKARALFATHYHELTKLAEERSGVCNLNVAVREWNDQIIFLRKIIPGGADKSYGIQVARLAGLPREILDRAKEILAHLETPAAAAEPTPKTKRSKSTKTAPERPQLDLL